MKTLDAGNCSGDPAVEDYVEAEGGGDKPYRNGDWDAQGDDAAHGRMCRPDFSLVIICRGRVSRGTPYGSAALRLLC